MFGLLDERPHLQSCLYLAELLCGKLLDIFIIDGDLSFSYVMQGLSIRCKSPCKLYGKKDKFEVQTYIHQINRDKII